MTGNLIYEIKSSIWRASAGQTAGKFYHAGLQGDDAESATTLPTSSGFLEQVTHPTNTRWIGTDESGKGDYFGPLAIAGVLVTSATHGHLLRPGVRDSKQLSDGTVHQLARQIRQLCPHSVTTITPRTYNALYAAMGNLNHLLAWGHARVIEVLLSYHPCTLAITDQFGHEKYLRAALKEKGRQITVIQRPHAEADLGVASASVLAREAYLTGLQSLSSTYHFNLPKGAGRSVIEAGRRFVAQFSKAKLKDVAKEHFVTTDHILNPHSYLSPSAQAAHIAEVLASLEREYRRRHK